jgi:hypothetical protein
MEKIQLYKTKKLTVRFLVIGGIFFFIVGVVDLISAFGDGFKLEFPDGDIISILYMAMGIMYCLWGYSESRKSRYFIYWDNEVLEYLSPKSKTLVSLNITDIKTMGLIQKGSGIELDIETTNGTQNIRFEHLEWKELNGVKELIAKVSEAMNKKNM